MFQFFSGYNYTTKCLRLLDCTFCAKNYFHSVGQFFSRAQNVALLSGHQNGQGFWVPLRIVKVHVSKQWLKMFCILYQRQQMGVSKNTTRFLIFCFRLGKIEKTLRYCRDIQNVIVGTVLSTKFFFADISIFFARKLLEHISQ